MAKFNKVSFNLIDLEQIRLLEKHFKQIPMIVVT